MKLHGTHRLFLFVLFSFFLFFSPWGELLSTILPDITPEVYWPPETVLDIFSQGTDTFLDTKAGNLCGNHVPDIVTLRGQQAQMIVGPAIYQPPAVMDVPRVVNAMEILPSGPSFPGTIDALVVAGTAGLELMWWVHDETNPENGFFDSLSIDDTWDWDTVHLLKVADVDKDDWLDIVGVGYSGGISTIRVLSSRGEEWTPIFEFSVDEVIKDMEVLKWKPSSFYRQIALILEQSGLCIFQPFGGRAIYSVPHIVQPTHPDSLVRLEQDGAATDQLGWITPSAAATPTVVDQDLHILQNGTAPEVYELGITHVVAAVAFDRNDDGYEDLLLSSKDNISQPILMNQKGILPTGPTFLITQEGVEHLQLEGSETPSYNDARPLAYDIDSDGDYDVMFSFEVEGDPVLGLYRNESVDHLDLTPYVELEHMDWDIPFGKEDMYMRMLVDPPNLPTDGATHLDVIVFTQESCGGQVAYGQSLNAKALTREHVDIGIYQDFRFKLEVVGNIHDPTFAPIYHAHLRFIQKESDKIVKVWPTEVVWFSNKGVMETIQLSKPELQLQPFHLGPGIPPETGSSGSGGVSGPNDLPNEGGGDGGTSEGGSSGG
ncbi:MAG: hypothetical protein ABIK28_03075 [Planctomycetota bacterium]